MWPITLFKEIENECWGIKDTRDPEKSWARSAMLGLSGTGEE